MGTILTYHLFFFSKTLPRLFPSPPGGCHLYAPLSLFPSPALKHHSFFLSSGTILMRPLCLTPASSYHLHTLPLPHASAPVSLRGEVLQVSGALGFFSGSLVLVDATLGMRLDHLPLEVRGTVLWDYNNRRDGSWQFTTPRALHRAQNETHAQSF